jgi:hypothetical protein
MSQRQSTSKMVEVFDQFCAHLGEGLTGRAVRLESSEKINAVPTDRIDALDDSERQSRALALGFAPGSNARWLEGVLAEDELRQPEASRSRCVEQRWKQFRELADLLAFTLERTKYRKLARAVRSCHQTFRGFACLNGHVHAKATDSCSVRLCPFEMRTRSMRALHRFHSIIEGLPQGKYVVLAERNAGLGELGKAVQHLFESLTRLRKMPIFRGVRGAIVALEITYNRNVMEPDFRGERLPWHPHLNVVLDAPFLPFEQLRDAWIQATEGRGRTAFIRGVDRGTANELLKYVTKLLDFIDVPDAVEEFLDATHRRRFIRTYGSLYGLNIEDEPPARCPDCDSPTLRLVAHTLYPHQVFIDSEGILRIHKWAICMPRAGPTVAEKVMPADRAFDTGRHS